MALKVKSVDINEIHLDPANVRKHDERNIRSIMSSLQANGQQTPIVICSKNIVRKGNGTVEAARRLGWTKIDATVTALTGAALIAYSIADNRTSDLSTWDETALIEQLKAIENEVGNLEITGFTSAELEKMLEDMASQLLESSILEKNNDDEESEDDEVYDDDDDDETVRTLTVAFTVAEFEQALSKINEIKAKTGNIGLGQVVLKCLTFFLENNA